MSLFNKRTNKRLFHSIVSAGKIKRAITKEARRKGVVIVGARSIQKQIPSAFSRGTTDWDLVARKPKMVAKRIEKRLDRITRGDNFYVKKGQFGGLYKVMDKGNDGRRGTRDDIGFVDVGPFKKFPTKKIGGVNFSTLRKEIKSKRTAIRDKTQKFRHRKDREDIRRIKLARGRRLR